MQVSKNAIASISMVRQGLMNSFTEQQSSSAVEKWCGIGWIKVFGMHQK